MARTRPHRTRDEITRAIARIEQDELRSFDQLSGIVVEVGTVEVKLTVHVLQRWAREGRMGEAGRTWLDAIKRGETWYSSEAAVGRFLRALRQRQAG